MADRSEINRVQDMQQFLASSDQLISSPSSNTAGTLTISTGGPATPRDSGGSVNKALAWHRAVANRPLPALLMPIKHFRKPSHINITTGAIHKTITSPTLSARSSNASEYAAGDRSIEQERRTRKEYRLDMRNQVVAGLWKALQELRPT